MSDLFAGLDVSTQSCKLIVIDYDEKTSIFLDSVNYDRDLPKYNTENGARKEAGFGVSESDPNMWIDAIHILFRRLQDKIKADISKIKSISVSGQQHGLVTIDKNGDLSRKYSKLWNDFSTVEECEILTKQVGGEEKMIELIGNTQRTGYTAPKIFHMVRNEPENYKNTETIFLVHNYINWILTGGNNGGIVAMESGDVSGSALWDPVSKHWADTVISAIAPDLKQKLPPVKNNREFLGNIGKEFVKKYGFSTECKIASGSGDNMMGAIGTGNYTEGVVTISLGTSGTAYTFMKDVYVDPKGEIACFCDATGNYLPLLCVSNMANGYEAYLKTFKFDHQSFDEALQDSEPGNGGKVLCPWFEGERTPDLPQAAPIYFGFTKVDDFMTDSLMRALMEGPILNLYDGFQRLPVNPQEIRLTGGISKSAVWRETIANIFNCDVVHVLGEAAAMGAALHAAWSYYKDKNINEIALPFIDLDESSRIEPDPALVKRYKDLVEIFTAVSRRIRGLDADDPFKLFKEFNEKYTEK
ncbi:MAG: xylulokinase [Candidatus Lokiarchaeota archaeon]|nr:xylulokinase [Candidatus Lokiarchaeota archaeon]